MEDFREIDDILSNYENKKVRVKSGDKGNRHERELCKILNKRFAKVFADHPDWGRFSRSVGSGNRWGQGVVLSQHAKATYSGDLTCPANFLFVIESKGGYNDIDLCSAFDEGQKQLDEFLDQVEEDSERSGRRPLLVWKKDYKPRLAFVKQNDLFETKQSWEEVADEYTYCFFYREWVGLLLSDLLDWDDSYFFDGLD